MADSAPYGKVKCVRSDSGTEFTSDAFRSLLRKNKIRHEMSAPYSPHQHGTAEQYWRTLFEMGRCLLIEAELPKDMWPYAVMAAAYIRNRCYNERLKQTPYHALTGGKPNLSNMRTFGSEWYPLIQNTQKLDAKCTKGIFVGYDRGSTAYLVYFPGSGKVRRYRVVKFVSKKETVTTHDQKTQTEHWSDNDDDEGVLLKRDVKADNTPKKGSKCVP